MAAKLTIPALAIMLLSATATGGLTAPISGMPGVYTTGPEAIAAKPVVVAPACDPPGMVECVSATLMVDGGNNGLAWKAVLAPISEVACVTEVGMRTDCATPGTVRWWEGGSPPPPEPLTLGAEY